MTEVGIRDRRRLRPKLFTIMVQGAGSVPHFFRPETPLPKKVHHETTGPQDHETTGPTKPQDHGTTREALQGDKPVLSSCAR